MRPAKLADVPALVSLMSEFYGETGYSLRYDAASRAFESLLGDPDRGRISLVQIQAESVGYIVLTLCFSMEYGAPRGFVDDFFIRPGFRGRGLGVSALETVKKTCRDLGVHALLVETGAESSRGRGAYERAGFEESGRMLLTHALALPIHET